MWVFAALALLLLQLLDTADFMVISPRWEHLRWKTVGPDRVDVRRTGEVLLTCSATGSPAPALAWYKDGLFTPHLELVEASEAAGLGESVARLRLPCASKATAGKYECRARAGEQELSAVTEVRVVDWAEGDLCSEVGRPEVGTWSPTMMVEEGQDALLRCRPMGSKTRDATVTWSNDENQELGEGERHQVTAEGDLIVRDVSFLDMGTYTCRLSNSRGSDQVETFLYPLAPSQTFLGL